MELDGGLRGTARNYRSQRDIEQAVYLSLRDSHGPRLTALLHPKVLSRTGTSTPYLHRASVHSVQPDGLEGVKKAAPQAATHTPDHFL